MKKLIAAINMTLDGYCDHTAITPDEEVHQYYADLLDNAGAILYGRTTYQLMEYWRTVLENPTGDPAMDDFAVAIDRVPKLVFSRTLKEVTWDTAKLADREPETLIAELKRQPGKDLYVGSPGLIADLAERGLIDEYQLCIHPVILGSGTPLFRNITGKIMLELLRTRSFRSGAVIHYYEPARSPGRDS